VPIHSVAIRLNRFPIGNFRFMRVQFDLVPAFEPFLNDLQMQFAHPGNHELFRLFIPFNFERWVFLRNFHQRPGKFCFIAATFR